MNCIVSYKGYQGSVSYEDRLLVVKILHIDDLISTTFDRASEAEAVFAELVNDYIATCEDLGKEPCKPHKGTFNVRISPEVHRRVALIAAEQGETLNSWVARAIDRQLDLESESKIPDASAIYAMLGNSFVGRRSLDIWESSDHMGHNIVPVGPGPSAQIALGYFKRPRQHG